MFRKIFAGALGLVYSAMPLNADDARKNFVKAEPVDRDSYSIKQLGDFFGEGARLGEWTAGGDRFLYPVIRENADASLEPTEFVSVNGRAVGNFTLAEKLKSKSRSTGRAIKRDYFPTEDFVGFCVEDESGEVVCGYGLFVDTPEVETQRTGNTLVNGVVRNGGVFDLLAGKIVGVRPILPERYGGKQGIVVENYFERRGETERRLAVLAFNRESELELVERLEREKVKKMPDKLLFYLQERDDGSVRVRRNFDPSQPKSFNLESLAGMFPSVKTDELNFLNIHAEEVDGVSTVSFECVPCVMAKEIVRSIAEDDKRFANVGVTCGDESFQLISLQINTSPNSCGIRTYSCGQEELRFEDMGTNGIGMEE